MPDRSDPDEPARAAGRPHRRAHGRPAHRPARPCGCSTATDRRDREVEPMSSATAVVLAVVPAARQRVLRRRRVRPRLRPPHPDRAARRGRVADGAHDAARDGEHLAGDRRQPARHHRLLAGPRCRRRAGRRPPARAAARTPPTCPTASLHPVAFAIALSIVVYLHVVLGEMVPKNIALAGPDRAALVLGPPIWAIVTVLRPVIVRDQRDRRRRPPAAAASSRRTR